MSDHRTFVSQRVTASDCPTGKLAFARRRDAKFAMRRLQTRPECTVRAPYLCTACGLWHLTSHPNPRKAATA